MFPLPDTVFPTQSFRGIHDSVIVLEVVQTGVTFLRWQEWFTETGQTITVPGQIDGCLYELLLELDSANTVLPTLSSTHTHTRARARTHARTHTHTHTHARTHARAHEQTHESMLSLFLSLSCIVHPFFVLF